MRPPDGLRHIGRTIEVSSIGAGHCALPKREEGVAFRVERDDLMSATSVSQTFP